MGSELKLDESALEAAMVADSKCQQESCNVPECNGFFCHRALAAYIARSPSRNDVLEEALKRIASALSYPVDTSIDPRGYRVHSPNVDNVEFAVETAIRALKDRDR